ncbi:ASCH domain-containing protein [Candidatus Woesearchaeota archaeon]|nr:ASCH domain-containing protein [Candidatus Woesearchaeota archaeon]
MKALSLKQPWAELVVSGKKTIETRTWNTSFRGTFLVHASRISNKDAMKRFGFTSLPTGCIVGEARLVDVKSYGTKAAWDADEQKHLARIEWTKKRYGYLLADVKRLKPQPLKGRLNFFAVEWDPHTKK